MIIEASKPQFGSIINLLLRFILHLSALQLMLWLQSYNRLKFCATDRKVGGRIQGQDSIGFGGRIRDHVTFIYLLSRLKFLFILENQNSQPPAPTHQPYIDCNTHYAIYLSKHLSNKSNCKIYDI